MHKRFLIVAAISGALSVILGAFGAHSLRQVAAAEVVSTFETGVRYQFYHTFAILGVGILCIQYPGRWLWWSGILFTAGIVLFSGSLYAIVLLRVAGEVGLTGLGLITPFGGLMFVAGWLCLLMAIVRNSRPQRYSEKTESHRV